MKYKSLIFVAALPMLALANNADDKYFGKEQNPTLTPHEKNALKIGDEFRGTAPNATPTKPLPGKDGSIRFVFGLNQPQIVCAVLQICDIAFQPGEEILDVKAGDTARWEIAPSISGFGATRREHIIVKPYDVNLKTNLVVNTDRRSYHIQLRSHRDKYMAFVEFVYPEDAQAQLRLQQSRDNKRREGFTTPRGEYLGNLDFGYEVDGKTRWIPSRVYNDGRKTIIEMPEDLPQTDAPALLTLQSEGNIFKKEDARLVNYRVQSNRYIVDSVPDKIILLAGVGSRQQRVTITRTPKKR
jgi:type IV secretion system protein VirB9